MPFITVPGRNGPGSNQGIQAVMGQIPDGSYVTLNNTSGLEGYQNLFKKQGSQFIPVIGAAPSGSQVYQTDLTPQEVLMAATLVPLQFAIKSGQTEAQRAASYNNALNDTSTPRSFNLPPGYTPPKAYQDASKLVQNAIAANMDAAMPKNLSVQEQLNWIKTQTENITKQVGKLAEAEKKGLPINPSTTIQDAESFLATGAIPSPNNGSAGAAAGGSASGVQDITQAVTGDVAFKNSDAYKLLDDESKAFVDSVYNLLTVGGEQEAKIFAKAIDQAKKIADPYYSAVLTLAKGDVEAKVAQINNDYEGQYEAINRAKSQLLEDVKTNKDFLTLEQQAELSTAARNYDDDVQTIRDVAASKGITFSTGRFSREEAEQQRKLQYQDVTESSNRQYNFKISELEKSAARGDTEAQKQLENLKANKGFALGSVARSAEATLGTEATRGITGLSDQPLVGGVTGSIAEEKNKAIVSDVGALVDLQKGFL